MAKKNNISSILWEDVTSPPSVSKRHMRRRMRKPINVVRRMLVSAVAALIGIALMIAPLATNYLEYKEYAEAVKDISSTVADLPVDERIMTLDDAYRYNEQLALNRIPVIEDYNSLLNLDGNGVMGLLRLPKLSIVLPIYHSSVPVNEVHGVIQLGPDGSARGSSLPVGGPSTHALISNINSLPSSKQFSMITELNSGDRLNIAICGEELSYEIYETMTVSLADASTTNIVQGEDLVTLVLANQGNDESRFVVKAKRSQVANNLYLGDYDPDDISDIIRIVFLNMSIYQAALFIVGSIILLFFFGRFIASTNDRAPKEMGRLIGDTG